MRQLLHFSAAAVALAAFASSALALDVDSPYVEESMMEIETQNRFDFDDRASEDRFRQHKLGVGYGFTSWWAAELEGEWEKDAGQGYDYKAAEIENVFQFTQQGEYFVDVGAELKYEFKDDSADEVKTYLLLAKPMGQFTHVANIGLAQEVGSNANENPEGELKWMTRYNYVSWLNPGFEYYGEFGEISDMQGWDEQKHRIGPAIYGKLPGGVKYELGWLFGISERTEDHALKLNLEYEFPL